MRYLPRCFIYIVMLYATYQRYVIHIAIQCATYQGMSFILSYYALLTKVCHLYYHTLRMLQCYAKNVIYNATVRYLISACFNFIIPSI